MRSRRSPSVHIPGSAILPSATISNRRILRVFFFAVFARILMADAFYHAALSGCTLLFRCVLPVATDYTSSFARPVFVVLLRLFIIAFGRSRHHFPMQR